MALVEDGVVYYFLNSKLGAPQLLLDSKQQVVWEADYSPFGEVVLKVEKRAQNLRFPGQYYDAESGLHYNWHRYYDPALGRYLQPDPIGLAGGANLYAYVGSNPVNRVDPMGLETTLITTYDLWIGTHSAMHISRPGQTPFLYDPAGSYDPPGGRGTGDFFDGSDANLSKYIGYQKSTGSDVDVVRIPTTPQQETRIIKNSIEMGGTSPGWCSAAVSGALNKVCGIEPSAFPGRLAKNARRAECR